jgi:Alginate export
MDTGAVLYGKLSAVASYTWGTDAFDTGDTGAVTLEEGYLGLKREAGGTGFDLSLGPRELVLGTGMIIANGGSNGFERGALKLGPRKAWDMAAIGRLTFDGIAGTAFFLSPNELPSTDSENELGGLDLRYDDPAGGYMGATFVSVLNSDTPYPQAAPGGSGPPTVTPGARDGTGTLNLYAGSNPMGGALDGWTFTGDLALQENSRIDLDARAGRITASRTFADVAWSPVLTLGYQTFSGDDPDTATLERFDPLYYQGSPSAWATGSKSAATFINANVNALTVALAVRPSQSDTLTLRYAHIRANELNSPIQFGQATRVNLDGNVVAGVTDPHLADDLFLEYSRIVNRNTYQTAGLSVSGPGTGIDGVIGQPADPWTGAFINVVLNY